MDELARSVIEFVAAQTYQTVSKLHMDSRLFHDLGVDGDDGIELLQEFGRRYGVNLEGVDVSRYFGPEAHLGIWSILRLCLSKKYREGKDINPIRIADLVVSAREKKWTLPNAIKV